LSKKWRTIIWNCWCQSLISVLKIEIISETRQKTHKNITKTNKTTTIFKLMKFTHRINAPTSTGSTVVWGSLCAMISQTNNQ
jgi:hypothetical protein